MILLILAYAAGALTILSPCILPVLPFVFSRAGQPFARTGLPMLLGMAAAFAGVASLASVGAGWAVAANQYGRDAALALFALFGATLLSERLAQRVLQPLAALGQHLSLSHSPAAGRSGALSAVVLGVATGLLWAPCAGPILGLVLTGAALNGASAETSLLLLSYALGAATSLALALFAGGQAVAMLKRSFGVGEWLRRGIGVAVLSSVALVATGWDAALLSRITVADTTSIEQALINWTGARRAAAPRKAPIANAASASSNAIDRQRQVLTPAKGADAPALINVAFREDSPPDVGAHLFATAAAAATVDLPVEGSLPGFAGATEWLNSTPLTPQDLRGKVVLVNFWTFDCSNCLNELPHVRAWAAKYRDHGLVVIGVHTPELPFERDLGNVRKAVARLKISYPVAVDNGYAIWRAFGNEYWPAAYFIDAEGRIRHHHFGEHDYENSERVIQTLLAQAGNRDVPGGFVAADGGAP
jgi:cytochrome c biogenesis protein CcdA/thiol-disulfide isomerase/thioredoxin